MKGALDEPASACGFHARRFSGDSSVYGNADLRLRLGRLTLILPAHFGVYGLSTWGESGTRARSRTPGTRAAAVESGSRTSTTAALTAYIAHAGGNIFHVGEASRSDWEV
jgi:hypothetical protein